MRSMAASRDSTPRTMRSSTVAWTVTSSAVVGSSQTRSPGSLARAIATTTRWRWPPESWCGKALAVSAGSRRPTWPSNSSTRSHTACPPLIVWWTVSDSATCTPTRMVGLSAVIGSWNTMAPTSSPSAPSNRIDPSTTACSGSSPIRARLVSDLPEPDSPMSPTRSPRAIEKVRSCSSATRPIRTDRSRTSRTCSVTAASSVIAVIGSPRGAGRSDRAGHRRAG